MIPRSRLTFSDAQRLFLRYIALADQNHAAMREGMMGVTVVRCRLCGAEHRSTIFNKPERCECCTHPLGKDGAA
jgi:predicted Zn-ribbon and HTH transcriptional regulator